MSGLNAEPVRDLLKRSYPEIAHAADRETTLEDGTRHVESGVTRLGKGNAGWCQSHHT